MKAIIAVNGLNAIDVNDYCCTIPEHGSEHHGQRHYGNMEAVMRLILMTVSIVPITSL